MNFFLSEIQLMKILGFALSYEILTVKKIISNIFQQHASALLGVFIITIRQAHSS